MSSDARQWDLARLRTFVRVAAEGSLTRVATSSGSPQSFISRQIAKLETEFGGKLFLRTGRGVVLSELGHRVMPRVQALLQQSEELTEAIRGQSRAPSGKVVLATIPSLYMTLVVPLVMQLRQQFPGIRLRVIESSGGLIEQWLGAGTVDIGVTYRYGAVSGNADPLAQVPSFLVAAPGDTITARESIPFARLDGLPLVLPGAPSSVRVVLDRLARRSKIRLQVALEADSGQIQRALAMHAGLYTVAAMHSIQSELNAGNLQAARITHPEIIRTIAMGLTSARPNSAAVRETARAVRSVLTGDRAHAQLMTKA